MRVLFLSNIPTPYQLDFLGHLSTMCDLRAIFLWSKEANRDWIIQDRSWLRVLGRGDVEEGWKGLSAELLEFQPESVVVGGYLLPLAQRLKWYCYRHRISYFYWLEKPLPANRFRALLRYMVWRITLPFAHGIFCIGNEAIQIYKKHTSFTFNVPYSIDASKYRVRNTLKTKLPLRCIFVGQFVDRKGIKEILEAFAIMPPNTAQLSMVGSGELLTVVEDYASRFNNIHNLGFIDPTILCNLFAEQDIFILPSRHDGWAVVVAEAMAAGLPIIGTLKTGAFVDLVVENRCGLVCEVASDSILNAVKHYAQNPEFVNRDGKIARQVLINSTAEVGNASIVLLQAVKMTQLRFKS